MSPPEVSARLLVPPLAPVSRLLVLPPALVSRLPSRSSRLIAVSAVHFWDYYFELLLDIFFHNVVCPAFSRTCPKPPKAITQNIIAEDFMFDSPRDKSLSQS